jgi:hypothetical protein
VCSSDLAFYAMLSMVYVKLKKEARSRVAAELIRKGVFRVPPESGYTCSTCLDS